MKNDLKLDAFGNLDAEYYVERAYELRRAYYAELAKKINAGVKRLIAKFLTNRTIKNTQPQL